MFDSVEMMWLCSSTKRGHERYISLTRLEIGHVRIHNRQPSNFCWKTDVCRLFLFFYIVEDDEKWNFFDWTSIHLWGMWEEAMESDIPLTPTNSKTDGMESNMSDDRHIYFTNIRLRVLHIADKYIYQGMENVMFVQFCFVSWNHDFVPFRFWFCRFVSIQVMEILFFFVSFHLNF